MSERAEVELSRCTECGHIGPVGAKSHLCYRSPVRIPGGRYGVKDVLREHYADTERVLFREVRVLTATDETQQPTEED